ncbi:hypothetical protein [Roseicyclus mahoneyensis]|uniref:hypothetical protein n=1 Tax=Roseicyclus mahoneyensis TaxID=164332 RepID=UPI000D6CB053|nr:hypothetical protein [Roseicyclus mahoneyensis]
MTKEIDRDLFVRLMQMSAPTRKELLEFIGQGPVSAEPLKAAMACHESASARRKHGAAPPRRP